MQSPEGKLNLSWNPISLGAISTLPHPGRPVPRGWRDTGHGREMAEGDSRGRAPCHSPQSGWTRHTQHGNVLVSRGAHPRCPEGTHRPPSSRPAPRAPPSRAPAAFHCNTWRLGASAAPCAELSRGEAA